MRITDIDSKTLEFLLKGRYIEAIQSFKTACDLFDGCESISDCCQRCLIPKLRYMSLSNNDKNIDIIITELLDLCLIDDLE